MVHKTFAIALLLLFALALPAAGQEDTAKAPVYGWKHSLVGSATLTQMSFTDWAQGGENALAWALGVDGKSVNDLERTNWANSAKLAFGQTRLGEQGIKKTDDRIDLESMLTYKLSEKVNPYGAATFKSQFAKGYKYDSNGNGIGVSKFFDPAYLTQSAGVVYQPIAELKTRFGVGLREIITSEFTQYADDPSTLAIEKTSVNGGLEWVTELNWKVEENILFSSKLELFSTFKKLDEVIMRSDNVLAAKVSKYIVVLLNVQFLNERTVSPRTQIKETLALGISYTFI